MSEKKPKILYIVRRLSGGIFTYLVELSNRLVDLYDITIGYATNEETPENIRSHFDKRISLVPIVSFQGKSNLINDASARTELRALAETIIAKPVHCQVLHNALFPGQAFEARIVKDGQRPVLAKMHVQLRTEAVFHRQFERLQGIFRRVRFPVITPVGKEPSVKIVTCPGLHMLPAPSFSLSPYPRA